MKNKTTKIQTNRTTEKKEDYSPETVAKNFWLYWLRTIMQQVSDRIMNRLDIDQAEKKHHLDYVNKKKSLPPDLPVGGIEDQLLDFHYLQKPNTDWDKIKDCLRDLDIDNKNIELLVFILKRAPIEHTLVPQENPTLTALNEAADSMISEFNQKIRELSPLIKRLEKLQEVGSFYKEFHPLSMTIEALRYEIALCHEIIQLKKVKDRQWLDIYCLDKDLKKSPQKHKYWNHVASFAVNKLNEYYHNDNCERNCSKTHQKAYTKVAELLKILYPSIWKEDIKVISNRIKQKDYRAITK